jgi:large exoprotein involved in heme utilization and adhesion
MTDNAFLSVSNPSGLAVGQIVIRGGQLTMEQGSRLAAITTDNNTLPGLIDVHVTEAMTLSGNGTTIDTSTSSNAAMPPGDILIQAGSLTVMDGAQIKATNWSTNNSQPRGGNIDITADTVLVTGVFHHPTSGSLLQSGIFSEAKDGVRSGGGRIRITANELSVLDGAAIDTTTEGLGRAGDIEITSNSLRVSGVNSEGPSTISSRSSFDDQQSGPEAGGDGGTIRIRVTSLDLHDGGQLNTSTETAGNAGLIDIHADTIAISGNRGVIKSGISAKSEFSGSPGGDGGNVSLTVDSLSVGEGGSIELGTTGGGPGGHLVINADQVALTNGGIISSGSLGNGTAGSLSLSTRSFTMTDAGSTLSTRTFGPGNGGAITLLAENALLGPGSTIDSRTSGTFTRADPTMQASGGSINVSVGSSLLLQGGRITASSTGLSSGGQNLVAVGDAGSISVSAGQVQLSNGAEISSSTTLSSGAGGTISVAGTGPTGLVQLSGGSIKAATAGSGPAGNIIIAGNTVNVSGAGSSIDSSTTSTGNAGNIQVQAGQVNLENGGTISSESVAPATGNAGSVTIIAADQFQSTGGKVTTSAANGQGGDITIRSDEILLNGGATIDANTTGPLDAGNILLVAGDRIMLHDSMVTTSASQASGGNIGLQAPELVRLRNGQIISSVQGGPGTSGGDITIDPQAVLLQNNSQILAQAVQGNGGNISITAGVLIVDGTSQIDASSQLGISGQVSLNASLRNVAGVITPLPQSIVSQANLYGQRCAAQKGGQFSSFVQGTRDGLPVQPGDFLPSPLMADPSTFSSGPTSTSEPLNFAATRLGLEPAGRFSSAPFVRFSGCRS